ncbi:hypothetical protein KY347_06160 [Candidatus Woesearchaeota archaeon]|nr:hypothetical protein [Candidatus Woesearchaeota archaeon]
MQFGSLNMLLPVREGLTNNESWQVPIKMNLKPLAIILAIAAVLNLTLFALNIVNPFLFWIITAVIGLIAYKIMPKLK